MNRILLFLLGTAAFAQSPELKLILERLDRLEAQNRELLTEVRELRGKLGASDTPVVERQEAQENRIAQVDQEKIATDHRMPFTLTGMALFNTFWNGRDSGGADNPTTASLTRQGSAGATFRQTVIGAKFNGPDIFWGGKVSGSVYADFFGGGGGTLNQLLRVRVGSLDANWKSTTLSFALDKPMIAPREPDSLSQVGVSPLTSAGNLWLWQPQIRAEQRFKLRGGINTRAQFSIYQTAEGGTGQTSDTLARSRPGYESRIELSAGGESRRIEIAPGFHASSTRIFGQSIPSRIFAIDWLIRPVSRVDFIGTFFQGENMGIIGGLRQGVTVTNNQARAVRGQGGWAQVKVRLTSRLTANVFGGQEDDRNRDLLRGAIAKNQSYAANLMYKLGTNILTSFEASTTRTSYLGTGVRSFPHYDLAIAYLF